MSEVAAGEGVIRSSGMWYALKPVQTGHMTDTIAVSRVSK
jgi:hypothetical protein